MAGVHRQKLRQSTTRPEWIPSQRRWLFDDVRAVVVQPTVRHKV
jgi:hypothetical protein